MKKIAIEIKWGIVLTILHILWMYLEKHLGWHDASISKHPIYTLLFTFIAILIYFLAIKDKKQKIFNNLMDWKQGFLSGCIVALVATLFSPLVQILTSQVISPDYFQNAINHVVENNKMSIEAANSYFNLCSYIFQAAFGGLSTGIVISAIASYFLKSK